MSNTTTTGLAVSNLGREWGPFNLIPGRDGAPYKAESRRDGVEPGTLERFTVWIGDDPRLDPHTHPWYFESIILSGGYSERRLRKGPDGVWADAGVFHYRAGDRVEVPANHAHVVFAVLPGTTTHMFIGPLVAGPKDWGHLVPDSDGVLQYQQAVTTPVFLEALKVLNYRPV